MARRMFAVTNYIGNIDRFSPSSSFLSFFLTLFLCILCAPDNQYYRFSRLHATITFITTVHKKAFFKYRERILCRPRIVKTNTIRVYVIHISILNIELLKHTRQICTKIGNYLDYYPQSILISLLHNSLLHRVFTFFLLLYLIFIKYQCQIFFFFTMQKFKQKFVE